MNKDIIQKKRKSEPELYSILMDINILTEMHSNCEIVLNKRNTKILNRYITKLQNNILSLKEEKYEKEKKYRFTDDVEAEQEILISIENEILEEKL